MIGSAHQLPVSRQTEFFNTGRGTLGNLPKPVGEAYAEIMRRIDVLHFEHAFAGAHML